MISWHIARATPHQIVPCLPPALQPRPICVSFSPRARSGVTSLGRGSVITGVSLFCIRLPSTCPVIIQHRSQHSMAESNIPTGKWSPTVANGVVKIRVAVPKPFDTQLPRASEGTGFVVDKTKGYILTNRHLVGEGPLTVRAIFRCGHSQSIVQADYIELLHDFAFVKYRVGPLTSEVEEIPLRPDLARVNLDVRVVGNDAGGVMSFHQGVIGRFNCNPPEYGGTGYQDNSKALSLSSNRSQKI